MRRLGRWLLTAAAWFVLLPMMIICVALMGIWCAVTGQYFREPPSRVHYRDGKDVEHEI